VMVVDAQLPVVTPVLVAVFARSLGVLQAVLGSRVYKLVVAV
jgi:hypothetical protein